MLNKLRNFSTSKFAAVFVFIIAIPFVFWGMGGVFSSGNTNNIAKINNYNVSTKDFMDYVNEAQISNEYIQENINNNVLEELLTELISSKIVDLEVKNLNIIISEKNLAAMIKNSKNFHDEKKKFSRIKYEKFLLENNLSAPGFEQRLKLRELQRNLFDYIGAGTTSPQFLTTKLFKEENQKLEIEFIDLNDFYVNKDDITDKELENFIKDNKDELKIEYLDFSYTIINPKNLIGVDDFNQSFFDKIDEIEVAISNEIDFKTITSNFDLTSVNIRNFRFSTDKNEIEKKIYELRNNKFDIFENKNDYILYNIKNITQKSPDLSDKQIKKEVLELVFQKNKFDYNQKLLNEITNKKFNDNNFLEMGKDKIQAINLNSVRDNKKFDINAVEVLYSLPEKSFTLINDENNNIYLAKVKKFEKQIVNTNKEEFKQYIAKQNSKSKNSLLKSYDTFLNDKYDVSLNQQTIERVKNYFK